MSSTLALQVHQDLSRLAGTLADLKIGEVGEIKTFVCPHCHEKGIARHGEDGKVAVMCENGCLEFEI